MKSKKNTESDVKRKASSLQKKLVGLLKEKKVIKKKHVEDAFLTVPRHLFLPQFDIDEVYRDEPIVTVWKSEKEKIPFSSSTQPAAMATMLEQLELGKGHKVLEIGTGTGFNAALMAEIVGKTGQVVSVDIDKEICNTAKKNLTSAGFRNVKVICKDGFSGYKPNAPYDRIMLTVSSWDIAPNWFEQLKIGGILVLPVFTKYDQMTIAFQKKKDHLKSISISGCKFMGFRGKHYRGAKISKLGDDDPIFFYTDCKHTLAGNDLYKMLNKPGTDFETGITVTERELSLGICPWIEISQTNQCIIRTSVESARRLTMPTVPKQIKPGTHLMYPGLIDDETICLLIRSPNKIYLPPKNNGKSELIQLYVRNFGKNDNLAKRLIKSIQEWDKIGRPSIFDLEVKCYFGNISTNLKDNEYIISKKKNKFLYSWPRGTGKNS